MDIVANWKNDLTGKKFDKLTVIKRVDDYITPGSGKREPRWLCECDCKSTNKNTIVVLQHNLITGHTHCCAECKSNRLIDMTGQKFNKLTVTRRAPSIERKLKDGKIKKIAAWYCDCDCGKKDMIVEGKCLRNGHTKSCGCAVISASKTHGWKNTAIYSILNGMKDRCYNKNSDSYNLYGGRGIKICKEWYDPNGTKEYNAIGVDRFCKWAIAHGYEPDRKLSIDRIDVNGDYSPENCRFVNAKIQANNRRNNRFIEYKGTIHTVAEWADITGIPAFNIYNRLNKGWSIDKVFETPINDHIEVYINSKGEGHTITEWSTITGLDHKLLYDRLCRSSMSIDEAISKDVSTSINLSNYNGDSFTMGRWDYTLGMHHCSISSTRIRHIDLSDKDIINTAINNARRNNRTVNGIYFVDNNKPYTEIDWENYINSNNINTNNITSPINAIYFEDDDGNKYSESEWDNRNN